MPGLEAVRHELGLGTEYDDWLAELDRLGPPPYRLAEPTPTETSRLLDRLGFTPEDATEALATRVTAASQPHLRALLERAHHAVVRGLGPGAPRWTMPPLPDALGPEGRFFPLHVLLSAVDPLRRWHAERGIPEEVTWATLQDVGRGVAIHRATHGYGGLDKAGWLSLHFHGELYELGRLQYELVRLPARPAPMRWYDPEEAAARGPGFRPGDPALNLHIPASGPLTAAACDASLASARTFFDTFFPAPERHLVVCTSWLLDEQLARYLDGSSHIVAFQRRFELLPDAVQDDREPLRFVFRRVPDDLGGLPRDTTLQRALLDHLDAGGHWRIRTGWFPLPGPAR